MTDQEFIGNVEKYLWNYLLWRNNDGLSWSFEKLYEVAVNESHRSIKGEQWYSLGKNHSERIDASENWVRSHEAEVKDLIERLILKLERKNTKEAINEISARATLEPMLDEAGLEYYVDYQKTGVKITVRLLPKKKAQLYMSYSRIREEADGLIPKILVLRHMYDYFGIHSGIVNVYDEDEKLFKKP